MTQMQNLRRAVNNGSLGPELPDHAERRRLRVAVGLTLIDAARVLGVSLPTLRAWETNADPKNIGYPITYRRFLQACRRIELEGVVASFRDAHAEFEAASQSFGPNGTFLHALGVFREAEAAIDQAMERVA